MADETPLGTPDSADTTPDPLTTQRRRHLLMSGFLARRRARTTGPTAPTMEYREVPLPRKVTYTYLAAGAERLLVWDGDGRNPPLQAVLDTATGEPVWVRRDCADVLVWDDTRLQVTHGDETWSIRTDDGRREDPSSPQPAAGAARPVERMMPPLASTAPVAWRRDQGLVARVGKDGRLRVSDGWSGEEQLQETVGPALRLGFTSDGRTLAVVLPTSIRRYAMPAGA